VPEGPSLVILRDLTQSFAGERIRKATGNAKIDKTRLVGLRIVALRTWGKHFLIELGGFTVRIHFLMFGRYCINERKEQEPRLSLAFSRGRELNFYTCAVRYIEGDLDDEYDWRSDVMSDAWDPALARRKLRSRPNELICDALLDQDVFAGVGNIIKNEVLFRVGVHPLTKIGALPAPTLRALVEQARQYSFEFLQWKKAFVLRQHWLVHNKGTCPKCNGRLARKYLGTRDRRTFFCQRCQKRFRTAKVASRKRARASPRRRPTAAASYSRSPRTSR
jgi:endonuclease-8